MRNGYVMTIVNGLLSDFIMTKDPNTLKTEIVPIEDFGDSQVVSNIDCGSPKSN